MPKSGELSVNVVLPRELHDALEQLAVAIANVLKLVKPNEQKNEPDDESE